jgi:hypothetical protein
MELRLFERRFSESPRVYRAAAKSSIGVWARQVSAAVAIKTQALSHPKRPQGLSLLSWNRISEWPLSIVRRAILSKPEQKIK